MPVCFFVKKNFFHLFFQQPALIKAQSAIGHREIKELLVRRRFLSEEEDNVNLSLVGLQLIDHQNVSLYSQLLKRDDLVFQMVLASLVPLRVSADTGHMPNELTPLLYCIS